MPGTPNEIRIVRNNKEIHSWESAQSFRRIPEFDGIHYREKRGTFKLKVARVDAHIYHLWLGPAAPLYAKKRKAFATIHSGRDKAEEYFRREQEDFGLWQPKPAIRLSGRHPAIMPGTYPACSTGQDQLNGAAKVWSGTNTNG